MAEFHIGDRLVGPDEPTFVIAEAGSNHNGDLKTAKKLVDAAANAGADAVKFQTYRAENMYPEDSDLQLLDSDKTAFELFKSLQMPYDWIEILYEYAQSQSLYFMSTPFDKESADELAAYVPAIKVPSSLLVHHPFLEYLASKKKPIVMSTGAKTLSDIQDAVEVIRNAGKPELALLQCTTAYPTPLNRANVRAVRTLNEKFEIPTGLSDHTMNPTIAPTAAVALNGSIIEKHITLDRNMDGPDQSFSLEPDQFNEMVTAIRKMEKVLGSGEKQIFDVEAETPTGEPCIHAIERIESGETISESNTAFLRPADDECELPPSEFDAIAGSEVKNLIEAGEKIRPEDLV